MYCSNCGQKLADEAVFCVGCGVSTQQSQSQYQYATPAQEKRIVGFILSFFMPLAGLIVSIIEHKKAKEEGSSTTFALAGIIISSVSMAITVIALIILIPFMLYLVSIAVIYSKYIPFLAPVLLI